MSGFMQVDEAVVKTTKELRLRQWRNKVNGRTKTLLVEDAVSRTYIVKQGKKEKKWQGIYVNLQKTPVARKVVLADDSRKVRITFSVVEIRRLSPILFRQRDSTFQVSSCVSQDFPCDFGRVIVKSIVLL